MNSFATPEWDSNPVGDKTCKEVFKVYKSSAKQKNKKKNDGKKKKPQVTTGRIEKPKTKQVIKNIKKNIGNVTQFNLKTSKSNDVSNSKLELLKSNPKNKKNQKNKTPDTVPKKSNKNQNREIDEDEIKHIKKQKPKVTHQTLFTQSSRKNRPKPSSGISKTLPELKERIMSKKKLKRLQKKQFKLNQKVANEGDEGMQENDEINENSNLLMAKAKPKQSQTLKEKMQHSLEESKTLLMSLSRKQKAALPLRERMLEKLKAARFRYLNEQMYTTEGKDAKKYFETDQEAYEAYHEGYKQQVSRWPLNPVDVMIKKMLKLPKTHIVADFGCGEAKLAKSVPQTVHSFDLVAADDCVTTCDMAHVPLKDTSVNVVVFCLSLMGTNLKDYLLEAHRVLKIGGLLKIAEVESRFDNVDDFIKNVRSFGFIKTAKDLSHNLFCFLDFVKKETIVKQKNLPDISLKPCLYKKR